MSYFLSVSNSLITFINDSMERLLDIEEFSFQRAMILFFALEPWHFENAKQLLVLTFSSKIPSNNFRKQMSNSSLKFSI